VLYIDGYPRWEYRYLKNLLLRADENLVMQVYLLSATVDFVQESSPGLDSLTSVPISRKELLDNYDVVILGDVSPSSISPDPAKCEEFMASLREFVQRGGGLLLQAGEYDNPRDFVDTPLEELVPVVLDATGTIAFEGNTKEDFRPVLEPSPVGGRGWSARPVLVLARRAQQAGHADAVAPPHGEQLVRSLPAPRHRLLPVRSHDVPGDRLDLDVALPLRRSLPRALLAQCDSLARARQAAFRGSSRST
jgi:hypothetical protein